MRNILQTPHFQSQKSKAGFDMSQRRLFTCMPGQLLPCYKDYLNPGDKVKINSSEFVRTEAIESAAFVELSAHIDWFFVPMQQLYQFWNEFFNSVQDVHTSFVTTTLQGDSYSNYQTYTLPFNNIIDRTRYWQYLVMSSSPVNPFTLETENVDAFPFLFNRIVDSGSVTPGDYFATDEFGVFRIHNMFRLLDMLEYGVSSRYANTNPTLHNYTLLDFLAYHRIFYSHYNDSRFFIQEPNLYNVDGFYGRRLPDSVASEVISRIHYRPYQKDFFTNISPSPVFSDAYASGLYADSKNTDRPFAYIYESVLRGQGYAYNKDGQPGVETFRNKLDFLLPSPTDDNTVMRNVSPVLRSDFALSSDRPLYNVSAQDLRYLFAFDKILQITQYSGSSYEEQVKAHYGYSVPRGISREAYFLGSFITSININEVVATATTATASNTAGSVIGDIAGKGFGQRSQGSTIEFEAPCHGILMAIHSVSVRPMYASSMCNKMNLLQETADFYHPEFDDLGLQPIFLSELFGFNIGSGFSWQYRYSEFKDKYDIVQQGLSETFRSIWQTNKQDSFYTINGVENIEYLSNNQFVNFFINPGVTNSIFAVQFTPHNSVFLSTQEDFDNLKLVLSPNEIYRADNFLCNVYHNVHKLSIMSLYSLPKLY